MSENRTRRMSWLDTLKGIAMISVVLGHVLKGNIQVSVTPDTLAIQKFLMDLVYSFHMPLFFTLSGYTYFRFVKTGPDAGKRVRQSALNLALLYLIYNVLLSLLKVVFARFVNNPMDLGDVVRSIFLPTLPLWYIYIMLFYYLIFLYFPPKGNRSVWFAALCAVGIGMKTLLESLGAPSCVVRFFYYLQFFWLGGGFDRVCAFEADRQGRKRIRRFAVNLLSAIAVIVHWVLLYRGTDIGILKMLCSYGVILLLAMLKEGGSFIFSLKGLRYVGKYSLVVYLLHTYLVTANRYAYRKLPVLPVFAEIVLGVLLGVLVPLLVNYLTGKAPALRQWLFQPGKAISRRKQASGA